MKNISNYVRTAKNVITANSPVLLVGTAIAGVVTTGVLAAKAGYKARGIVDEAELEKGDELTLQEKAQLTWLCYAAPAVSGVSTIAAVVGLHTIHTKRFNAMSGLYAITTTKLDEYADNAEQLLGGKKTQELNDKIAQKSADGVPLVDAREIYSLRDDGRELIQDAISGRWYEGSMATINAAAAKADAEMARRGDVSVNFFYEALGVPTLPSESPLANMGWQKDRVEELETRWGNAVTQDSRSALVFWFRATPKDL